MNKKEEMLTKLVVDSIILEIKNNGFFNDSDSIDSNMSAMISNIIDTLEVSGIDDAVINSAANLRLNVAGFSCDTKTIDFMDGVFILTGKGTEIVIDENSVVEAKVIKGTVNI